MTIPIIYEDDMLLVVNKPAGMLVHPVPGQSKETLIDWLSKHYPNFTNQEWLDKTRPGIVHRLDRDTSGVMLVAKNPITLTNLQEQFASRRIHKYYLALVSGNPSWDVQTIRAAISRGEGTTRKAQYFKAPGEQTKEAETLFTVIKRFQTSQGDVTMVQAEPKTGRTHQIRVHLDLLGLPILGDPWYETKLSQAIAKELNIPRLMLHAAKIIFTQPITSEPVTVEAPIPTDIEQVISQIGAYDHRTNR